jgi:hypothetical protein
MGKGGKDMDVNTMVNVTTNLSAVSGNQGVNTAARAGKSQAADTTDEAASQKAEGGAYALELSEDVGKAGAQAQNEAIKGLTSEQIDVLKAGIEKSQQLMIKTLTEQNARLQGWLDLGIGTLNFDGVEIGADQFALPAVGTTPEEAQAAISEGGAYSVDAVATRIFDLASAIAGGDPEKLKTMQAAVEEGFKQAGLTWKDATGEDDMPQITKDTHAELTKRFDDLYAQLTGKTQDE